MAQPTSIYTEEHEDFRAMARAFMEKEVVPHHDQWEKDGQVSREVWRKAGEAGLLCFDVDEQYGGMGVRDFRFNAIVAEEISKVGASGLGFPVHTDIIVPYISSLGTEEQKQRWLPGLVSGELISAIAMTEPGAGSDLQGIRTSAVDKGDHWVLNGSKTFISNGIMSDVVIVVARTDPDAGHMGFSLLVVEAGMAGFERGRNLDKMGLKAQDTAELFFDNVEVPKDNLLGTEGHGFIHLMENLPQERVSIACIALAACEHVLDLSLAYVKEREAFGKPIGKFQHNRFVLAEMATEAYVARTFINDNLPGLLVPGAGNRLPSGAIILDNIPGLRIDFVHRHTHGRPMALMIKKLRNARRAQRSGDPHQWADEMETRIDQRSITAMVAFFMCLVLAWFVFDLYRKQAELEANIEAMLGPQPCDPTPGPSGELPPDGFC